MSRENKKKIILIAALLLVLIALVVVYVFVVLPLMEEENEPLEEPPYVAPGEGLYGSTMITIYPQLSKQDINYLEIGNEHGTYAFHRYYDSTMETEEMRLLGYESIAYDQSLYSVLIAYVYLPVSYQSNIEANAPMRDLTEEQMRTYGVTEDSCTAYYKVGYEDENGETQYYTVYIGYPTLTDETTYYVSLKGRNTVYRFHQEGVETCMMVPMEDYLTPYIFSRFQNSTDVMVNVERFKIGLSNPDEIDTDKYIESIIEIVKAGENVDGTSNMYDLYYKSKGTGNIVKTGANAEKVSSVFTALYTYFSGDKVICVNPTQEQLKQYGLGIDSPCYYVTAQLTEDEGDTYSMQISSLIDGYYYTISTIYGESCPVLVRVPQSTLSFLTNDDKSVFEWAGTDVSSLFYEYLLRDEDAQAPGMYQITVRIQKKDDKTGEIIYNISDTFSISSDGDGGTVATRSDGTKYESVPNGEGGKENEFTDFYRMLIYFPNPTQFNNMTAEEIEALKAQDGAVVFELIARDNDDNLFRYTYYQIGTGVTVMIETCEGKMVNGKQEWGEPQVNFNTSLSQMDILRVSFQKLLNGEDVRPEDYIY